MPKPKPSQLSLDDDLTLYHAPIYLDPHSVEDAENVRPNESPAEHQLRVEALAAQIAADGQQTPIKVKETEDGYQIVAGQGRMDALRLLNNKRKSTGDGEPLLAWCVLDSSDDSWASAVKENVQRKNYTDVQIADLISEARTRYGWDTRGGGKKLAAFFGITEPLLVEYNQLASAPPDVKAKVQSGELSKSAALKLLKVASTPEKRAAVVEKARAIAQKEAPAPKPAPAPSKNGAKDALASSPGTSTPGKGSAKAPAKPEPPKKVQVQARHMVEAARQVASAANEAPPVIKRNRTEILAALTSLIELSPENKRSADGIAFLKRLQCFADGDCSPRQLQNSWNVVIGVKK